MAGRVVCAGLVLSEVPNKERERERPWPSSLGVDAAGQLPARH